MADVAELVMPFEGVNFLLNAIGFNQAMQHKQAYHGGRLGQLQRLLLFGCGEGHL
jgi:hypothetical protein